MSHNAFVQGLLENDCDVDILMASSSWGEEDQNMPTWHKARYYSFPSLSLPDKLRMKMRNYAETQSDSISKGTISRKASAAASLKSSLRSFAKKGFYYLFPSDPVYPLEKKWLKTASGFRGDQHYDVVVSNSSPAASHRLVLDLIEKKRIQSDRWIQIWEDPWYHDLYGEYSELIDREEHSLLQAASEIVYVSPLTLMYQKRYYPDCAEKMTCVPLPALRLDSSKSKTTDRRAPFFGYFGDYYSQARDLKPFYDALVASEYCGAIVGDSDLRLPETDRIRVSRRVTLDKLQPIQDQTDILVHLSNLRGGQIPGKIYQYSATDRTILFILDGTEEEKKAIKGFFEPFHRYVFCENTAEDISRAIRGIVSGAFGEIGNKPLTDFEPRKIVERILEEGMKG